MGRKEPKAMDSKTFRPLEKAFSDGFSKGIAEGAHIRKELKEAGLLPDLRSKGDELPYVVVDPGEEETFMLHATCPACGGDIEFSLAELMRCGRDDDRPRPVCKTCGRPAGIGHSKVWRDGELVEL